MSFRVLSAEIAHETNTFNIHPTTIRSFKDRYLLDGGQACVARGGKNTELAGLLDVGRDYGWEITHTISAAAGPGGIVTRDAFEMLTAPLITASEGTWDGIFLMLHGAMVTDFCDDGEGEILRRVRAVAGPDVPIAVTLDPTQTSRRPCAIWRKFCCPSRPIHMWISAPQGGVPPSFCSARC